MHRLEKWYHEGADVLHRLPLLSVYLGHGSVAATETYLHLSPELLHLAGQPLVRSMAPVLVWEDGAP